MKHALAEVQRNLEEARRLAASGQLRPAIDAANRAVGAADALDGDAPVVFEARAAAGSELALLMQRTGDLTRALDAYARAEKQVRRLPLDDPNPRYRVLAATTLINLSGLHNRRKNLEEASACVDEAITLLESISREGAAFGVLMVGALQNRAAIEGERQQLEEAEASLAHALEIGEGVVPTAPQLLPQLVEVCGRLAAVRRARGRSAEALAVAEKAARWAEAAYEAGSPFGTGLYVSTQLMLVDTNFASRRFAQAEDHLWKAVDVAPGPQTMLVGTGFYCSLLRLDDGELTAGGLPRDEVVDALDELIGKLREAGPPEELLTLVAGRRSVLVDGEVDAGEAVASSSAGSSQRLVADLVKALRSDVAWARSRASGEG